jgi:NADPH:quinone reductase-like Zn-dependent oxidoreductase
VKAVVWTRYGPPEVLELREVPKPAPKADEVLIKIRATTVTAGDCEMRSLRLPIYLSLPLRIWLGFRRPREGTIPGTEFAGEIESAGRDVKLFQQGDQVFGTAGLSLGTNAEYICLPESREQGALAMKPANMTFEEATTVPFGASDALHFLRRGNVQHGQKILINGAGGSIGTFAVQLAKHLGAQVSAVDGANKLEMLRSIGADRVIDYTREDFTKNAEIYDVIFDVVGTLSLSRIGRSISPVGTFISANPRLSQMLEGLWVALTSSRRVVVQPANGTSEDLNSLRELIEAGQLRTVIDRHYPLDQIAEAHRYVETGQKKGNLVVTVDHNDKS